MPGQFDLPEDAERLPEGFKRIAYDSDSTRFTFRDRDGRLYQGEAGAEYGVLIPMPASTTSLSHSRPGAFASESGSESESSATPRRPPRKQKTTFQDILPSDSITTSSLSEKKSGSPTKAGPSTATREQFTRAVRRSVLPKMQGVVHNLRRSVTSIRGNRRDGERELGRDETRGLVRSGSPASSSTSSFGSDIRRSATVATSRPHSKRSPP